MHRHAPDNTKNQIGKTEMNIYHKFFWAFLLLLPLTVSSQSDTLSPQSAVKDSSLFKSGDYIAKTGYSLAPLPEFMIDPFIGLYLGIYPTIFDYGDGKIYPNYYRSLTISAAYGTKGKTNFGLEFINYGNRIFYAKINYTRATLYPFYGYNGYQTLYNADFQDETKADYITAPFYNYHQEVTRLNMYLQDTIKNTFFNWQIGIDFAYYSTSRVDFDKLNKGVDSTELLPDVPTLYDYYVGWGLIDDKEKDGGWANALRIALVYDTRDRLTNPMHGIWTDFTVRFTPVFFGNRNQAVQLALTHRQYMTIIKEKLSFAYRLRYDACFGDLPFYTRQVLADGSEGLGGTNTLWGIHQNRILTKQFAMGNFELRVKMFRFRFVQQNWYLAAVPFFHTGYLIERSDIDLSGVGQQDREKYFTTSGNKWYSAFGFGGKIVMNENTVIGLDWGHSINSGAGNDAIYVGYGYSF